MEMTCIVCPNSCRLKVVGTENGYAVTGNQCRRGYDFAVNECTNPTRMFTSTVRLENADLCRLPVISSREIPKNMLEECQRQLMSMVVSAPVKCRDVIINNICNTGIDILASRSV